MSCAQFISPHFSASTLASTTIAIAIVTSVFAAIVQIQLYLRGRRMREQLDLLASQETLRRREMQADLDAVSGCKRALFGEAPPSEHALPGNLGSYYHLPSDDPETLIAPVDKTMAIAAEHESAVRRLPSRSNSMDKRLRRTLILDTDPDTLITLQNVLEEAEIDATITWDETEACQLIETTPFDLILIGDHPPELNAAAIVDNLSLRGTCPPVLILRGIFGDKDAEYFRRLGAGGVIPKRDPLAVLEQVRKALTPPVHFNAKAATAGLTEARRWRAAS